MQLLYYYYLYYNVLFGYRYLWCPEVEFIIAVCSAHCALVLVLVRTNIGQCVRQNIHKKGERGACYKYEEICLYIDGKIVHSTNIYIFLTLLL
jgi:hypothetical protein